MILPDLVVVTPGGTYGHGAGIAIAVSSGNGSVLSSVGCFFVNTFVVALIYLLFRQYLASLSVLTSNDLGSANFCVTMAGSQSLVVGFCIRKL